MFGFVKGILSDKGHVKRNTIIQIIIATIAFILLARIYPFSVVESHITSKQQAFKASELKGLSGDAFTNTDKKLQTVYFTNNHLYQVKLYMTVEMPDKVSSRQYVTFRVYDENFSCISSEEISLFKIARQGYLKATPSIDVETEKPYYYEIIVPDESEAYIELPVAPKTALGQSENSALFIDGIYNDEICLIADFDYSKPLSVMGIVFRYIIIIAIAMLIYAGIIYCLQLYDERFSDHNAQIKKIAKTISSIVTVLLGVYVIINSVILNKFGSPVLDRGVYFVAVVVGVLWILGALWLSNHYPKAKRDYTRPLIWKNYIQTVSFGFLFYALCQYVNADREFYHMTNTRWMLIFLAVAFLMILSGSIIANRFSTVWLVLGWICSAVYCNGFKENDNDFLLARLTCGVIVAWGLLIINIIISYKKQSIRYKISLMSIKSYVLRHKPQTVFAGLWIVFVALMYVYRFEKVWVFTATLPFMALLFIKLTPQIKSRFLKNFTNGIILSFGLVILFCLIHRPHFYWRLYRYGGIFHTVACTGMYLAMVFAALIGKLYGRLKDRKNMFLRCYYEFFLLGCVVGYIILTMSRTAFLTTAVCFILVSMLAAVTYKKKIKRVCQEFVMLVATVVLCFPMVFSAVRMIPALINDPVIYDLEYHDEDWVIDIGEPIYSDNYMTVERFFTVLLGRFITEEESEEASIYIQGESLLAFTGQNIINMSNMPFEDEDEIDDTKEQNDISNGRFKIFLDYIKATEFKGHPSMGPVEKDDVEYSHAHNSYLQVFYNFGIIAGIVFLMICVVSLGRSVDIVVKQGRKYSIYFVPFALIVSFGLISFTEWVFHPCIPIGFCFLLMQAVLIKDSI
jgi:hypothetical protein